MNAMLEPRIVAASTHGLALSAHGESEVPDRITASSHGCLMINLECSSVRNDSRSKAFERLFGVNYSFRSGISIVADQPPEYRVDDALGCSEFH
jgi:hypothetical protein